jgi:hypothetical protein
MRVYTVQKPPADSNAVVLKEGFSWWAFFFGPLWFLWHGMWASAILVVLLFYGVSYLTDYLNVVPPLAAVPALGLNVLVGLNARDWRRMVLTRRGYRFAGVVVADSQEQAEWTLIHRSFAETPES